MKIGGIHLGKSPDQTGHEAKLGFKNYRSACATVSGIEIMHLIRKQQAGIITPHAEVGFINSIMNAG